jgi:hypothetical protein
VEEVYHFLTHVISVESSIYNEMISKLVYLGMRTVILSFYVGFGFDRGLTLFVITNIFHFS